MKDVIIKIIKVAIITYILAMGILAIDWLTNSESWKKITQYAIVYWSEVLSNGTPSLRLKARLDTAYNLYKQQSVKKIIVSWWFWETGFEEAKVMHKYLINKGVPFPNIVADVHWYTTQLTSNNVFKINKGKGNYPNVWVIWVSQFFHMSRVKLSLKKAWFVNVWWVSADYYEWRDVFSLIREVPAYITYVFTWLGKNIDISSEDLEKIGSKIAEKIQDKNTYTLD